VVEILELAVKPDMVLAVAVAFPVQLLALVFGLGCWEAGINVLRNRLVAIPPSGLDTGNVGLLKGLILVEGATDEIRAVRQLGGGGPEGDRAGL